MLADGIYYWRVRACDDVVGCGPYSAALRFQVDTVPPRVALIRPNGGEILPASGPGFFDVVWTCADEAGGSGLPANPVALAYSLDGGVTFPYAIAAHEANDGLFPDWDTPEADSSALSVQVQCVDRAGNTGTDASDASFTVLTGKVFMNGETRVLIVNPETGKFGLAGAQSLALCSGVGVTQKPNDLILLPDRPARYAPSTNTASTITFPASGNDYTAGCAMDNSRWIYIAGVTTSTDLATPGAFQTNLKGSFDGFVAKVGF